MLKYFCFLLQVKLLLLHILLLILAFVLLLVANLCRGTGQVVYPAVHLFKLVQDTPEAARLAHSKQASDKRERERERWL